MRLVGSVAMAAVVATLASDANARSAADDRVALAEPVIEGSVGVSSTERLKAAIAEGLARGGVQVANSGGGTPCADAKCATELASATGAGHVVTWRVAVKGRDFEIEMTLRDAAGAVVGTSTRSCVICGMQEVVATAADQAAALRSKLDVAALPPHVRVTTDPSGAEVRIDGSLVGVTPMEAEVEAGAHEIEVSKDGYAPRTRVLTSVDGVDELIDLELRVQASAEARRPLRTGGAIATSLGAAMLITGATFLAIHQRPVRSRCSGSDVDTDGDCRLRFNGLPSGIPLVIAGTTGLVTGIVLLVVDARRNKPSRRARLQPAPGGIGVQF